MFTVQLFENGTWNDLNRFDTSAQAEFSARLSRSVPARVVGPDAAKQIATGTVVRLPFHEGGDDSEMCEYEIESFGPSPVDGAPAARLIHIRDGARERTARGHFRRCTRTVAEIERWN